MAAQIAQRVSAGDEQRGGWHEPLTKRERFAMAAMQGSLAGCFNFGGDYIYLTAHAIRCADALLAGLARPVATPALDAITIEQVAAIANPNRPAKDA